MPIGPSPLRLSHHAEPRPAPTAGGPAAPTVSDHPAGHDAAAEATADLLPHRGPAAGARATGGGDSSSAAAGVPPLNPFAWASPFAPRAAAAREAGVARAAAARNAGPPPIRRLSPPRVIALTSLRQPQPSLRASSESFVHARPPRPQPQPPQPLRAGSLGQARWLPPDVARRTTPAERHFDRLCSLSANKWSLLPLGRLAMSFFGKVGIGLGADLLMEGISREPHLVLPGGITLAVGCSLALVGGLLLAKDAQRVDVHRARIYGMCSIAGTLVVAGGFILAASDLSSQILSARLGAFFLATLGIGMLVYSLPMTFAYSEIVHGNVLLRHRGEVQRLCLALGLSVSALTLTRPGSRAAFQQGSQKLRVVAPAALPYTVGHVIAVVAVGLVTTAGCLAASDAQRLRAGRIAGRLDREQSPTAELRDAGPWPTVPRRDQ